MNRNDPYISVYDENPYLGSGAIPAASMRKAQQQSNRFCLICSQPLTDDHDITSFELDGLTGVAHRSCLGESQRPTRKAQPEPVQHSASSLEPQPSRDQCILCHRPIQASERIVQRQGIVAHEVCANALLALLGRGDGPSKPPTRVLETPDRADVRKAVGMVVDTERLARAIAEKYR